MNTRAVERWTDRDLRWAIEREEFEVHYQPVIELSTGRVDGFEALARWRHRRVGWRRGVSARGRNRVDPSR